MALKLFLCSCAHLWPEPLHARTLPASCWLPTQAGEGAAGDNTDGGKKRWYEEKKKRQEEQLAKMGLGPDEAYRLESAEVAEFKYKKQVWRCCVCACWQC